jgi:phosphate transport system substrate-binding protein
LRNRIIVLILLVITPLVIGGSHLFLRSSANNEAFYQNNKIVVGGSSSGILILEIFKPGFEEEYPGYTIHFLPGTETRDGLGGVSGGMLDAGAMARPMKMSEKKQYPNLRELFFLTDAVVLGANQNVKLNNLSTQQIKKIYRGEIADWQELGAQKGQIIILDRGESSSTKIALRKHILGTDFIFGGNSILLHSADSVNRAIETTPNALGLSSLGIINHYDLKIKPLAIDGISPSAENVERKQYKLVRTFGIAIRKGKPSDRINKLINFLFSDRARKISENCGFVPLIHGK